MISIKTLFIINNKDIIFNNFVRSTKMSILSFACSSAGIFIVQTTEKRDKFRILYHDKIVITPNDWLGLVESVTSIIQAQIKACKPRQAVIVKVGKGMYHASPETYKAEGFIEYILSQQGLDVKTVARQSLPKALGCMKGEKWQQSSTEMFKRMGTFVNFNQGYDAACAGAWSCTV